MKGSKGKSNPSKSTGGGTQKGGATASAQGARSGGATTSKLHLVIPLCGRCLNGESCELRPYHMIDNLSEIHRMKGCTKYKLNSTK